MSKARILAVDDQLYFRTFLEGMLVEEGYEVETACDGKQALHAVERESYDIVITDLVMPEMDGRELVEKLKERIPDQEIIVLSGVGDVETAVGAMKFGATDYLLKPIDRAALIAAVEAILQRRRLSEEHSRLMGENLEFMRVLSVYERGVGWFATVSLEPLAERIVEGLCLDTGAQGGVLWIARDDDPERYRLAAARGLVAVSEEPAELIRDRLPADLAAANGVAAAGAVSCTVSDRDGRGNALVVALRHAGRLVGIARLSDKLEGRDFDDADRAGAEKLAQLAGVAIANALRFRSLERRSFRDAVTRAYTLAYFEDGVRNEIHKAQRFGRRFSILSIEIDPLAPMRRRMGEAELGRWLEGLVFQIGRALRSTDVIAAENESRYRVLLSETDALGAAVLKRRIRGLASEGELFAAIDEAERPRLVLASASYPADGTQLDLLARSLEIRLEEDRRSLARSLQLAEISFAQAIEALTGRAKSGPPEIPEQMAAFLLKEVARRPRDRGLLVVAPGAALGAPIRNSLERLKGVATQTEIVFVGDGKTEALAGAPVSCVSTRRAGTRNPFLLYYGEGPAYAMVQRPVAADKGTFYFHSSDRTLVEELAFHLQRDLGISLSV